MQIKLFICLCSLSMFNIIGIGFSETKLKEQPLSAIDWLTDIYLGDEVVPNLINPSIDVDSAFSTTQPINPSTSTKATSRQKRNP